MHLQGLASVSPGTTGKSPMYLQRVKRSIVLGQAGLGTGLTLPGPCEAAQGGGINPSQGRKQPEAGEHPTGILHKVKKLLKQKKEKKLEIIYLREI